MTTRWARREGLSAHLALLTQTTTIIIIIIIINGGLT